MKVTILLAGAAVLAMAAYGCKAGESGSSSTNSVTSTTSTSAKVTPAEPAKAAADSIGAPAGKEVTMAGGLKYTDLKVGDGDIAEPGLMATVHYTGWLTDGTKFDSSVDRNQPFQFRIGAHNVISGWDNGVVGMRVGGKRHLVIPPDMGYGANGYPPVIPANATLVFDVELLGLAH